MSKTGWKERVSRKNEGRKKEERKKKKGWNGRGWKEVERKEDF